MAVTFLVVPQWQGSSNARAMRLVDGAEAIRGDLPSAHTRVVDVPSSAGDDRGSSVARLSSIALVRQRALEALEGVDGPVITIGGDCGADLVGMSRVAGDDVAVVYFDAHPDVHSPDSSDSKAFHGMVVRTVLGEGPDELLPDVPLDPRRLVFAGVRAPDPGRGRLSGRRRHRHRARPVAGEHRRRRRGHRSILGLPPHRPRRARSRRDLGARVPRAVRDDLSRARRLHRSAARPLAACRSRASPSSHRRRRRMRCRTFRSSCASSGR